MKKIALHWKILIGLLLGIIWAILSSVFGWSEFTLNWIDPFGTIFLNLLKLVAVPLVLFSIIKGVSNLSDISKLGRLGPKTIFIYVLTTLFAVAIGLSLVNLIKPGNKTDFSQRIDNRISYELWVESSLNVSYMDSTRLLSDTSQLTQDRVRIVKEIISNAEELSVEDIISDKQNEILNKTKSSRPLQFVVEMVPDNIFKSLNSNGLMLQVIFFAIFFGIVLLLIPKDKAKPLITLVDGLNEVFLKMVDLIMRAAPFFVFTLLAGVISKMAGDSPAMVLEIFKALGWYSIVVILGLFIMAFIFYPLLIRLFVPNISYIEFFKKISPAQLLAFSTSSSVATLPVTMDCVQDNLKVPKEITSFVLPIGATVNMDGTSLYQAVAVIFLAQFHMVDLSISQQLVIVLTATLASIGAAAVPSAGLIMMILVLESVGLNPAWIAIVFPIDRLLDMCRTVVNVTGDATVATVIASSEGKIMELDTKD
jgi:Na+/H+-dicarboxylate symporter|tara:strand:- start:2327 stop:3766 length:1440 start_codon:yes stop_codon:yes gene_type:complete